jgi:two-component system, NarL family, nitrate/nitrite response regulator NarL
MTISCLIVDDNPRFARHAAEFLNDQGMDVLGLAAGGDEAVRLARDLRPDLVLIDIGLGEESGFDVARRLCRAQPGSLAGAVILISTHGEEDFAELIADSPAAGFISKSELSADAIETLLQPTR